MNLHQPAAERTPQAGPIRCALTGSDLTAIHAAARTATTPAELLQATLAALDTALTRAAGTGAEATQPGRAGYVIPTRQWDQIFDAITGRAHTWGMAAEVGLDLALNLMPAHDDDSDAAPPEANPDQPPQPDPHSGEHRVTLTADAVNTIAACQTHLRRLRDHYDSGSPVYRQAADSWTDHLTALLLTGRTTVVTSHGPLGLLVHTGGLTWALVYRPAAIDHDGAAHTSPPRPGAADHQHTPAFPTDDPAPGQWIAHT